MFAIYLDEDTARSLENVHYQSANKYVSSLFTVTFERLVQVMTIVLFKTYKLTEFDIERIRKQAHLVNEYIALYDRPLSKMGQIDDQQKTSLVLKYFVNLMMHVNGSYLFQFSLFNSFLNNNADFHAFVVQ